VTAAPRPALAGTGSGARAAPLLARVEWWWVGWAAAGLALAEGPLLLGACCGPAGLTGLGTFWFVNDFSQYEAAMRQGASGASWLIHDQFTPEAHRAALMFTAYVGLGKLAALLGAGPLALYRPAELLARLALLLGVRRFALGLFATARLQRLAAVLILFGMGLGLPAALYGALRGVEAYTGNGSYEVNTFGLLFSAPHAALAMAITLEVVGRVARAPARTSAAELTGFALAGLALALLHPFHLPALLAGLGLFALARLGGGGRDVAALARLAALAAGAAPLLVYDAVTFAGDPFWSATYSAQNLLPSPPPWALPIEYGVVLVLAVPGAVIAARRGGAWWAVLAWLALLVACSYVPLPYQRRLGFGAQPALAALAVLGLAWASEWMGARAGRALELGALALALATTAVVSVGIVASALRQEPLRPYRADLGSAAAARVLAARACAADLVLADWNLSNYLAGAMPARLAGGHPVATLDAAARRQALDAAGHDPTRWAALARELRPSYVLYGPAEAGLPPPVPTARRVFAEGDAVLYALDEGRCG